MKWTCSNCGTSVDSQFKVCWQCGTDINGKPDENFPIESTAEDFEEHPEIPRIRCLQCGYQGKVLFSTRYKTWWEWMLSGIVSLIVSQRSWIHFAHQICPNCDADQEDLANWTGVESEQAESIWESASKKEAEEARSRKRLVLLVILSLTAACLTIWLATK